MSVDLQQFLFILGGGVLGCCIADIIHRYKRMRTQLRDARQEILRLQDKIVKMQERVYTDV